MTKILRNLYASLWWMNFYLSRPLTGRALFISSMVLLCVYAAAIGAVVFTVHSHALPVLP